jgi:pheromone shutdown-related protein TraB
MSNAGHVTHLQHHGRDIYIVGTAHVSQRSVEEVRRVIDEVQPDTVCVELDKLRYDAMVDRSAWQKLDVFEVIRQQKVLFLLTSLALSAYQKRIGQKLGVRPGAEMLAAVESARSVGAELVLADRDIQATLKRTWHSLGFWNKMRLASGLVVAPFAMDEISAEQVEKLKDRDTVTDMLHELARVMPGVKTPLIDERDAYLMGSVEQAPGSRIVAIVGAGHVNGMVAGLGQAVDREALCEIPPPSLTSRVLKWVIPLLVLGAFYFGYTKHSWDDFQRMILAWVLPTALGCGLFTLAAGAKLLTVVSAMIAAPITTLHPAIGAGMVTGLVEAWLRKPTVTDCENATDAIQSVRGIYANPFTRVLLVAVLSTLGAALGAWVGATWVVSLL